jgi:tRNA threonylcarbamoyladenosine biosynthesis protein TsaB
LFPLVADALAAADTTLDAIDLLAVSIGPGSFTGLRIGLSMAKGLALAHDIPLVGVPTLEALAAAAPLRLHPLWTVLDARKGEIYAAAFIRTPRAGLEAIFPASVCTAQYLSQRLEPPCTVAGDAVDTYGAVLQSRWGSGIELLPPANVPPSGAAVARLGAARYAARGHDTLSALEPCYVRMSEAERSRITSV